LKQTVGGGILQQLEFRGGVSQVPPGKTQHPNPSLRCRLLCHVQVGRVKYNNINMRLLCAFVVIVLFKCGYCAAPLPYHEGYRLGDILSSWYTINFKYDWEAIRQHINLAFPGTIGAEYMNNTPDLKTHEHFLKSSLQRHIFYDILRRRVREMGYEVPKLTDIVVHLRLGDTCDYEDASVLWDIGDTYIYTDGSVEKAHYVKPKSYYDEGIKKIPADYQSKGSVVFVGSLLHSNVTDHTNCIKYRDLVMQYFKDRGYQVQTRFDEGDPDRDFVYMSFAKNFIGGGGGYSLQTARAVHHFGGKCLHGDPPICRGVGHTVV